MKPGTRLKSTVCDTEVVVISGSVEQVDCGGQPMDESGGGQSSDLNPDFAAGTLLGKRYVDADDTIELLCVKPGQGSLSVAGIALTTKDAKPLPSSD